MRDVADTSIDGFQLELDNSIYEDVSGKLIFEVRDFGKPERTLVIRNLIDGNPIVMMVGWSKFTDALDEMRGRMMSEDWDESLVQLLSTGGTND
jgi:hypothetical protein